VTEQQANRYIFGDPVIDRQRLDTIARVYIEHVLEKAYSYVGRDIQRILDVGCGEGQLGFTLLSLYPNAELVGVDRDEKALAKARQQAEERGLRASYVAADIQEGIPEAGFDLVFCFTVLEHTPRYKQAVDNMVAAIAPGGHIWIQDAATDFFAGYPNPDMQRAANLYVQAMTALGNNLMVMGELPQLLAERGMVEIQGYNKDFEVGGFTRDGQDILAGLIGSLYAARAMLSKMTGVAEDEIGRIMERIADDAMLNPKPGYLRARNVVARKAEQ
jgi:2-polyprenyl-3-methyl-5-hydroxy-6-metoxy-1,4-benzoquinol methylase